MHPIFNYDLYIFDCDGVILNSNLLKIEAMKNALTTLAFQASQIDACTDYFSKNFGKSRFHHVAHFVSDILKIEPLDKTRIEAAILADFSQQCQELYLNAEITPGFIELIQSLPGRKYVASGSEQSELRAVFQARNLSHYFVDILGSPTKKSALIADILQREPAIKAIMIGDAVSDFEASKSNHIEFICYIPYSNVATTMRELSMVNNFDIIEHWPTPFTAN